MMRRLTTSICLDLEEGIESFRKYGGRESSSAKKILTYHLAHYDLCLDELREQEEAKMVQNYESRRETLFLEFPDLKRLVTDAQQLISTTLSYRK